MMRSHRAHRAVRLLGAVAVTGVLSAGVLAAAPASAQTYGSSDGYGRAHNQANGLSAHANGLGGGNKRPADANGLRRSLNANGL